MVSDTHAMLSALQFSQIGVALHQITTETSAATTSSRAAEAEGTSCGGKSLPPQSPAPWPKPPFSVPQAPRGVRAWGLPPARLPSQSGWGLVTLAQAAAFARRGGRVSGGQRPLCQPSCPAHPNSSAGPCSSSPETQAQGGPHRHYSSDKHSTDKGEHRTHSRRNGNGHARARVPCRTSASSRGSWY